MDASTVSTSNPPPMSLAELRDFVDRHTAARTGRLRCDVPNLCAPPKACNLQFLHEPPQDGLGRSFRARFDPPVVRSEPRALITTFVDVDYAAIERALMADALAQHARQNARAFRRARREHRRRVLRLVRRRRPC